MAFCFWHDSPGLVRVVERPRIGRPHRDRSKVKAGRKAAHRR